MASAIDISYNKKHIIRMSIMSKLVNLSGKVFGRLTVIGRNGSDKHCNALWLVDCECGKRKTVGGDGLRKGVIVSCGCYGAEQRLKANTSHGMWRRTEYRIWADMLQRCNNDKQPVYQNYGARGISVCDRWDTFENFYEDMGDRPSLKYSLDRIDNDGDYTPDNCRWATNLQQSFNKRLRSDSSSGIRGVSWNKMLNKYHVYISVHGIRTNIGYTADFFEACCMRRSADNRNQYG